MKNFQISMLNTCTWGNKPAKPIGFTLLELMVSIAILGIMGGIAFPLYADYMEKTRVKVAIGELQIISLKITTYFIDRGKYPETLDEVDEGTRLDPWGKPYQYLNIETAKGKGDMRKDHHLVPINSDFDLYSMGKDGKSSPPLNSKAGRDDIIRANDGAYIGLASDF